jgi:nicotinamidase-related amidase
LAFDPIYRDRLVSGSNPGQFSPNCGNAKSIALNPSRASDTFLVVKRPVLIVIDMLNDFLDRWEAAARQHLTDSINELIDVMHGAERPIIWVRQEFEPDLRDAFPEMRAKGIRITIRGTSGCQIVPELVTDSSDVIIVKKRYSAFHGTNLDELLTRLQPDALILAGINTHACIRTAAIDAYQRDWPVVVALDCVDSYDKEHHEISLKYMAGRIASIMTNEQIRVSLQSK